MSESTQVNKQARTPASDHEPIFCSYAVSVAVPSGPDPIASHS
jgi:hypothetical protein